MSTVSGNMAGTKATHNSHWISRVKTVSCSNNFIKNTSVSCIKFLAKKSFVCPLYRL
jgi:hypothetical protein